MPEVAMPMAATFCNNDHANGESITTLKAAFEAETAKTRPTRGSVPIKDSIHIDSNVCLPRLGR
eukprot:9570144-Alexandrium_andersonii.AAC.1